MGFFSSLVDSVKSAGQFVMNHSAQIEQAATIVGKVASLALLALPEEKRGLASDGTTVGDLESYSENFTAAAGYIQQQALTAVNKLGSAESAIARDARDAIVINDDKISGVWSEPAHLDDSGYPSLVMYKDLANFLGQMKVPTTVTSKAAVNGQVTTSTTDVVALAGAALFADTLTEEDEASDNPVKVLTFEFGKGTKSYIQASHAYYKIPTGKAADQKLWHSALYVKHTTTKSALLQARAESSKHTIAIGTPDQPGWIVTMNIDWPQASFASDVIDRFHKLFEQENSGDPATKLTMTFSQLLGVHQLVKVHAPAVKTPAQVLTAINKASSGAITQVTGNISSDNPGIASNYPPICAAVKITDSSYVLAASDRPSAAQARNFGQVQRRIQSGNGNGHGNGYRNGRH
jgi:hypothetical protein